MSLQIAIKAASNGAFVQIAREHYPNSGKFVNAHLFLDDNKENDYTTGQKSDYIVLYGFACSRKIPRAAWWNVLSSSYEGISVFAKDKKRMEQKAGLAHLRYRQ